MRDNFDTAPSIISTRRKLAAIGKPPARLNMELALVSQSSSASASKSGSANAGADGSVTLTELSEGTGGFGSVLNPNLEVNQV